MQSYRLTIDRFLDHAAKWWGDREVVTADSGRIGYAALRRRSNHLSGALANLDLKFGQRVGTLGWNTQHHLEIYYAAMGAGYVCHTLNPRLTVAHLAAMVNEAEDRVLAVGAGLCELASALVRHCPTIESVVLLDGDQAQPGAFGNRPTYDLESLLGEFGGRTTWGDFPEDSPSGLCYTSGTTGPPRGVLYTHRSSYLHTLRALQADALALTAADSVLVAVPMFHANAWGFPFAAPAVGAKLVLTGRNTDGARLAALIRSEQVTVAAGVQTVWQGLLDYLDGEGGEVPSLERVVIGGARCPDALIQRMETRLRARVQTSWGMTELSPLGTIAPARSSLRAVASGRPPVGLDLKLTDAAGATLPQQRNVTGYLKVKGASVVERYFGTQESALDAEGYFDTGDLATIDDEGNLTISGRTKDLIKSGGEWINPAEIESLIGRLPGVGQVAVIGQGDDKWGERPVLVVEPQKGHALDERVLLDALRDKVADWWIPDRVIQVSSMPLSVTGKIDKVRLRAQYSAPPVMQDRH
ncbi:MAG TPA: AMP-binding protein [Steroidobacteraceae bacterium]|jgi:acyl-CoA synthetase (AMP-forming)/AMP-acid ligase II|nr:AMP-binding protein [Steroidobacteraceae bacterium]